MDIQIDDTDRALLAQLAENARLPVATLARRLGLARSTAQARLDRLEQSGVIAGYALRMGAQARAPLRATALPMTALVDEDGVVVRVLPMELESVGELEALVREHLGVDL